MSEPKSPETKESARGGVSVKSGAPKSPAAAEPATTASAVPVSTDDLGIAEDKKKRPNPRVRRARLRISRIDPWSVMKTSFLFSIAFGIMMWVAVYVIWTLLEASGMFAFIDDFLTFLLSNPQDQTPVHMQDYVNTNKVMGVTALIGVVNVVLLTALGTILAFLYNLSAGILGGLELTLAED